jgi:hypothetical protein
MARRKQVFVERQKEGNNEQMSKEQMNDEIVFTRNDCIPQKL